MLLAAILQPLLLGLLTMGSLTQKIQAETVKIEKKYTLMQLTKMYGFHFLPLSQFVVFLVRDIPASGKYFAAS
jgi:hypothetical protein